MDVALIAGSPRSGGRTVAGLRVLEDVLGQKGHGVDWIHAGEKPVNGCTGCMACQCGHAPGRCVQKDHAEAWFERLQGCEGVVYATPLYGWDFSGQMKLFLDRHFSLVSGWGSPGHHSRLDGKRAALLVTCAGPVAGNADLIPQIFSRLCSYLKLDFRGLVVWSGKGGADAEPIRQELEILTERLLS